MEEVKVEKPVETADSVLEEAKKVRDELKEWVTKKWRLNDMK